MRFFTLVLLILVLSSFLIAQQKYLVTPSSDFIPVGKYDNPSDLIAKYYNKQTSTVSAECTNKFLFGYPRVLYNNSNGSFSNFGAYHKDVMGQWFVAKASGTLDSIFWYGYGTNGALESLIYIRIHKSILGNDWGPGLPPYQNAPPCQSWGYWLNSSDQDNGVAAFPDDATDTTWHSTINEKGGTIPKSRPPFAEELWGQGVGYGVIHRTLTNRFGLMITGLPCDLTVGDKFFISMRINSLNQHIDETHGTRTEFSAWGSPGPVATSDENWPSRDWKFYEHDSGPSNCSGFQTWEVKRGWVARGPLGAGTTTEYTALYSFWYQMTVTTNVPPTINAVYQGDVQNTFDTGDQTLTSEIYDCNPADPGNAGVDYVLVEWWKATTKPIMSSTDFVRQTPDITMSWAGVGDLYNGIIPGQPVGTSVMYRLRAYDKAIPKLNQFGPTHQYKVVTLDNPYYLVDTTDVFTHKNIATTGTKIDTSKFFTTPYSGHGLAPKDDGTAGPYSLGGPFVYFGDTMYYAWIGVNGAMALSKTINDTIDVNSNGFATSGWDFPMRVHHHRPDSVYMGYLPPNFIAPLWADIIVGDTINEFGKIRYDNTTNPNEFIAEWDSVGAFFDAGTEADISAFRVVLNRSDGTIKFQYKHTGTRGVDTSALVGIAMDSSELSGPEPGFIYVNRNGAPFETRPRENWQITFTPGIQLYASDGWNLLSVAMNRTGMSMAKEFVYPGLVSDLFIYTTAYEPVVTAPAIPGFWAKFSGRKYAGGVGKQLLDKINTVNVGWNIIGTISKPVLTANVTESTPGMVASEYFPYLFGTYPIGTTTLVPGLGYWVKVGSAGTLRLQSPPEGIPKDLVRDYSQINKLTITDRNGNGQTFYLGEEGLVSAAKMYRGDLPPGSPEFNARYKSTGGAVATYPARLDEKQRYEYPISISAASYPITVRWEIVKPAGQKMGLLADGKYVTDMEASGFVRVKSAKELTWKIGGGKFIPTSFALGQNYPNPFNPVTKFTVDVPRLTDVEVVVYDLLGRKIRTLVSGEMEPGRYDEMRWDGTDGQGLTVPTGIYFIRMAADEFSAVQKVMLMK